MSVTPAEPAAAVTTTKTQLQYFLSPHPDDVFMAWSLVQNSTANYPVFITLTKGESTGYCKGTYATPITIANWGTYDRAIAEDCKAARMASLNNWFDDQSDADSNLNDYSRAAGHTSGYLMVPETVEAPAGGIDTGAPTPSGMGGCAPTWGSGSCAGANPNVGRPIPDNFSTTGDPSQARQVTWWVGETSARVEFDLGDGNLTNAEVIWAFEYVRANRAEKLPLTTEYGVVAAGFSNLGQHYTACTDYSHHDHRAIHEAVHGTDLIPDEGKHPQWGATCGSRTTTVGIDTEALPANGGRADEITPAFYNANMAGSSAYFQKRFGWLRGGNLWPSGTDPTHPVIFARWNYFWRRF
ncbi:hypothetical protein [Catellatospora paridis]|uniref:hypothetical protein n=1 Tax=Catellatospora paridis TaxID=1617086 RepID=UPI0012D3F537|nr:hypothetical protein [Catellatospora paridis]